MQDSNTNNDWVATGEGARRRVLAHEPQMMMVEFDFQAGAVGALHSHPHIQSTYVAAGVFEFTVDGETKTLKAGDSLIIPSNAVHGCVATEPGTLIDTFTPRRDDFL